MSEKKNKSTDKPKKPQPKSADLKVTTTSNHSVTPSRSVSRSHSKSSRKSANASASGKSSRPSSASIKTPPTTLIAPSDYVPVFHRDIMVTSRKPRTSGLASGANTTATTASNLKKSAKPSVKSRKPTSSRHKKSAKPRSVSIKGKASLTKKTSTESGPNETGVVPEYVLDVVKNFLSSVPKEYNHEGTPTGKGSRSRRTKTVANKKSKPKSQDNKE